MLSTPVTLTANVPLSVAVADAALPTTALVIGQPLALNVASAVVLTTGSTCTVPGHCLDSCPEKLTTDQGTDADSVLTTEEEGTNTRKVRKTPLIVAKISNNSSKIDTTSSWPSNYRHILRKIHCSEQNFTETEKYGHTEVITDLHIKLPEKSHQDLLDIKGISGTESCVFSLKACKRMFLSNLTVNRLPKHSIFESATCIIFKTYTDAIQYIPFHGIVVILKVVHY